MGECLIGCVPCQLLLFLENYDIICNHVQHSRTRKVPEMFWDIVILILLCNAGIAKNHYYMLTHKFYFSYCTCVCVCTGCPVSSLFPHCARIQMLCLKSGLFLMRAKITFFSNLVEIQLQFLDKKKCHRFF